MQAERRLAIFHLNEALATLPAPGGKPFTELLRHGTLSTEIFAPRDTDTQQPHTRDEVYVVIKGRGEFVHGSQRTRVETGDFLFVPAGVSHRFEQFSSDLALWAMFYGPEGGERP